MLRVFGRLPVSGVTRSSEAGVRKASGEETAEGICAGSGVGLWRFSLCMPRSLDIERGSGREIVVALALVAASRIGTVVL